MSNRMNTLIVSLALSYGMSMGAGCQREQQNTPRPPATGSANTASTPKPPPPKSSGDALTAQLPPRHPPVTGQPPSQGNPHGSMSPATDTGVPKVMPEVDVSGVILTDATVDLEGLTARVPDGWVREEPGGGGGMFATSRQAQFRLPKADNDPEDVEVVITHFPGMRGMDDANLQRWYTQFKQPDGGSTAAAGFRADFHADKDVVVTLVDVSGTMAGGGPMIGGGEQKENYRMLAAIINHPKGPHFVKATGPSASVERWKASVMAFLKDAKVK